LSENRPTGKNAKEIGMWKNASDRSRMRVHINGRIVHFWGLSSCSTARANQHYGDKICIISISVFQDTLVKEYEL
jgi:hypothetical protein